MLLILTEMSRPGIESLNGRSCRVDKDFQLGCDDDDLDLIDSENGQCYLRRRTPESRREFQSIRFENVCRTGGRRRVGVRPASSNQEPNSLRTRSRRCPVPDNPRTPQSDPAHRPTPNQQVRNNRNNSQLGEPSNLPANQSQPLATDFVEATSSSVVPNQDKGQLLGSSEPIHSSAHSNSTNESQLVTSLAEPVTLSNQSCDEPLAPIPKTSCQPEEPLISVINSQTSPSESEKAFISLVPLTTGVAQSFEPLDTVSSSQPEEPLISVINSQTSPSESEKAFISLVPLTTGVAQSFEPLDTVSSFQPEEPLISVINSQTSPSESEKAFISLVPLTTGVAQSFEPLDTVSSSQPEEPLISVINSQTSPSESEKAFISLVPLTTGVAQSFEPLDTVSSSQPEEPLISVINSQTSPSGSEKAFISLVPLTTGVAQSFEPLDTVSSSQPEEPLISARNSQTSPSESEFDFFSLDTSSCVSQRCDPLATSSPTLKETTLSQPEEPLIRVINSQTSPSESEKALLSFAPFSGAAESCGTLPTSSPILEEITLSQPEEYLINLFDSQTSPSESEKAPASGVSQSSKATQSPALIETTSQPLISVSKTSPFDPEKALTLDSLSGPSQSYQPLVTLSPPAQESSSPPEEPLITGVGSKPLPSETEFDRISLGDKPSTTSFDDNMWNNQFSTGLTGSSHEFFDSFGLADSNTPPPQSRGNHTTPCQTSHASNSPAQFFEQNFEAKPPPFQASAQASNTVAKLFQPTNAHSFVASKSRPEQVGNHEENPTPVQAPAQTPMTTNPTNQASLQALNTSAHTQTGMNNSLQLPSSGTGAEHLENIEEYRPTSNQVLPQALNTPTPFQSAEQLQNYEGHQSSLPPQTLNTTATLFQPFQSFPPQTAIDPFGAMKVTPSNAGGTAQLFADRQHNDLFDSFSVGTQNFGMPPTTDSGYGVPAFSSSSHIQKQHSVEQLGAFSGTTNGQTWPMDQIGQSGPQFNTGHGHVQANVHDQSVHGNYGNNYPFGDAAASYPPNTGSYSSTSTQDVVNATNQPTGETLPAEVPAGLDVVKTTDPPAAQQPAAFETVEPVGNSDVAHATFQPPTSGLYPPTMVNGFQDPKLQDMTSSLYPPGLISSQPVSQTKSLYPPGMDLGETSPIFPSNIKKDLYPSSQVVTTSHHGTGELFTPDPNLLPPMNPGFVGGESSAESELASSSQSALIVASPGVQPTTKDFVDNHSGASLQSERMAVSPEVPGSGHFTSDPESNQNRLVYSSVRGPPNGTDSGLLMKNLEDNQIASNPPSRSQPVSAYRQRIDYEAQSAPEPLSQQMSPFPPVAEPVVSEKSSTAVYAEAGTPLLNPSGIAPLDGGIPSNYQQPASLQHVPEPVVSLGEAVYAEPGIPHLDVMATHYGTLPSINQQVPPSQTVAEPIVMPGPTGAVHAETGTPHLDTSTMVAHDGTLPPSQAPPLGTQGENLFRSSSVEPTTYHLDTNTTSPRDARPLDDKLSSKNQHVLPFGNQHEDTAATMFSSVGVVPYSSTSLPPSNVVPETEGELQGSPLETDVNLHPSAFIPVKANSPRHYEERPNLESPLRSPVEREKKEALLHAPSIQTSSLWDSEPQLAILGLIVPTATRGNHETGQSASKLQLQATVPAQGSNVPSIEQTGERSPLVTSNVVKPISGIPGFTQTIYPFTATPPNSSNQLTSTGHQILPAQPGAYRAIPSNQGLHSTTSPKGEASAHGSTSSLSRQSSLGISTQDQVTGKAAHDVGDKLSGLNRGKNQGPNTNQAPSVYDRPSSGRASDYRHQQSAPATGTETGLPQHTSMYPDTSRSAAHTGLPQNEQARVHEGRGGRVVPEYGGFDGHVDHPAGTSGGHGFGQSEVIVTQHGTGQKVVTQRGYGGQGSGQSEGMVTHPGPASDPQQQQQQQLQYQQQQQQQLQSQQQLYLHQQQLLQQQQKQQHGQHHMGHQQKSEHDQYMHQQQQLLQQQQLQQQLYEQQQQQQQLQQHQQLQRQTSGEYQQQVNSNGNQHYPSTQYQTTADTEQQQYEDFDSEEECNRYYDESRKWFWSHKRNKWIRADKSKREQDQYYDEQHHRSGSGRSRYEDEDHGKRRDRRRDGRHGRRRSEYDEHYGTYYDRHYYDREHHRGESVSSESSDDSQRRVTRSGRSSRAESPRSVSSRSSSRARRSSGRQSKHREYEYEDGYRKDEDYYRRSHQSSRNSRRLSSGSYSSTTSNSLGDNIKWDDEPKQQQGAQVTTEYPVERVVTPERLTPKQHSVPHIVGKFASVSRLSLAPPRRVLDGETAEVFVTDVTSDPRPSQMQCFPGPLCRIKSHKRDVVKFAKDQAVAAFNNESKSFEEREASYILWQVLALMVQQNGVYLNGDIAEVLTGDLPTTELGQSPHSSRRVSFSGEDQVFSTVASQQEQQATYRELLLCGKTQEALELAIASKMWGHALILSHSLDQNIFANIMNRFTGTLNEDDSLLCLYQHLSQKTPSVLDKKSRHWRKHLAIMIANPSKSPEQDRRNIHTLGENLESRGLIEAAHLCYILAGESFWKEDGSVLLGYSLNGVRPDFVDLLALQRTELFEYAMSLKEENYIMKDLQPWKAFYAHSLADAGLHVKAFRYCETMLNNILKHPTFFTENTIARTHALSVRLTEREHMTPFFDMNVKLQQIVELIQGKESAPQLGTDIQNQQQSTQYGQPSTQQPLNQSEAQQNTASAVNQSYVQGSTLPQVNQAQNINGDDQTSTPMVPTMFVPNLGTNMGQEQAYANNIVANPQEQSFYAEGNQAIPFAQPETTGQSDQYNMPYTSEQLSPPGNYPYGNGPASEALPSASFSYENVTQAVPSSVEYEETGLPSMHTDFFEGDSFEHLLRREPSATGIETSGISTSDNSFDYYAQSNFRDDNNPGRSAKKEEKSQAEGKEPETNGKKEDSKKGKEASGWSLGGFFKSLIPKGKNEMILPDDKKKTIYWDDKEDKWVNTDGDEEDKADLPPPPIDPSLISGTAPAMPAMPPGSGEGPTSAPGTSSGSPFNAPTSSPPSSSTLQPPVAHAPPVLPGNFTPEQPEESLINSPLTTPSRFSRRAHGSKGRRSNYVDVLSASGSTTKLNQTASPMLFSPFPTSAGNQATVANNFVPDSQPRMDGPPGPIISQNNVLDNNTAEEESANAQGSELDVSQPPPAVPFFDPSKYATTPSSSASRGRQYPRTKK